MENGEQKSGRAVQLVYRDESGNLKMEQEAVEVLRQVKGPVGVVSICGRARQGKSFMLNQLLRRSAGFRVGSIHRPCTKGLWMWSAPLKINAPDGSEINLFLMDSEGIDAYDQTGTYGNQIFSLMILLSSMVIYNQMGGIDEAALDNLSLVTEMNKHIRVKATGEDSVSELRRFFPEFVWLLRDFSMDLVEDNRRLKPHDYLELALRPVSAGGADRGAKNKIRESIRALFPNRECFTLVRPLDDEADLQQLDRIPLEKLHPEFRYGLAAFAKFIFEQTKPKQVGVTVMTGPILAGITKNILEALNNGAVPAISSSWQCVEELECRRAYDTATGVYTSTFDNTKPPEEVALRDAHDEAVKRSVAAFNASAVGRGPVRQRYEGLLQSFLRKTFEDSKRVALMEANLRCSTAIDSMGRKLQAASQASDAKIDDVIMVLDTSLAEYEASVFGPGKWQRLSAFLRKSFQDIVLPHAKKEIDKILSQNQHLVLKCCSLEEREDLLKKQLEASEKFKTEYQKHYNDAINDMSKLSDHYKNRISDLESKCRSLEENYSSVVEKLEPIRLESLEWKRKCDQISTEKNVGCVQGNTELVIFKSTAQFAQKEASEWKGRYEMTVKEANDWKVKYETAAKEAEVSLQKVTAIQESLKHSQRKEEALRAEFSSILEEKEKETKDKSARLASEQQEVASLNSRLEEAASEIKMYTQKVSDLMLQLRESDEMCNHLKSLAESSEAEAHTLRRENSQLDKKYLLESERFKESCLKLKSAETEVTDANVTVDSLHQEALAAQKREDNLQRLVHEKSAEIERARTLIENLEKEKADLLGEVERSRLETKDAVLKVGSLEASLKEQETEMESFKSAYVDQMLETQIVSEYSGQMEINHMHKVSSYNAESSPEVTHGYSDGTPGEKRSRLQLDFDPTEALRIPQDVVKATKKAESSLTPLRCTTTSLEGASGNGESSVNYAKLTVVKLRQELIKHGLRAELLQLKNPRKKDLIDLYERHVLPK